MAVYSNYLNEYLPLSSLQFYPAVNQITNPSYCLFNARPTNTEEVAVTLKFCHLELLDVANPSVKWSESPTSLSSIHSCPALILLFRKSLSKTKTASSLHPAYSSLWWWDKSALETSQQIPVKTLKQLIISLKVSHEGELTSHLEGLEMQFKVLDSIDLKSSSKIWKRKIHGLLSQADVL